MKSTRLKAGLYKITERGITFTLAHQEKGWSLWNSLGTEVMSDSSKAGIVLALQSYNYQGLEELNKQEWAAK
jgi:hypothetical protein